MTIQTILKAQVRLGTFLLVLLACGTPVELYAEQQVPLLGSPSPQTALFGAGTGDVEILPVDEAFRLNLVRTDHHIEVMWQIRAGHYLYRHRLAVAGSENLGTVVIPEGLSKQDEHFGAVEVYYEALILEAAITGQAKEQITVEYQGCSDAGICYPPQKRVFTL